MSSSIITYSRKRRSDDESSSSDSDEDVPPVKKSRLLNRESSTLPNFLLYIGDAITRKIHKIVNWIYQLPIGGNEREKMLRNSLELNSGVPIQIEEEEEDIDVVEIIPEDDDLIIEEEFTRTSNRSNSRHNLRRITQPLSSSTPVYRGISGTRGRPLNSLSRRPVNGCNNTKSYPTRSKRDSTVHQTRSYCRNIAPITSPSLEVEILLDTRETLGEESDDLEIVSEISNPKTSRRITRQSVSPIASKFGQASLEYNGTSQGSIVDGKAASSEKQSSLRKSFTAHEVIRLQEKAHYQLILDKMIGTTAYRPVTPKKTPKSGDQQVDLTTGDDDPEIVGRFQKESLEKPVNEFLQKYYKPCKFQPCASPKDSSDIEIFTVDDDVQVVETEKSDDYFKYKPKFSKGPGIFSTEWINDLKKTITLETEQLLQKVAAQEEKVERYRKRRDAKILKEKILRGHSISSDQTDKDEFPELTPDMTERVEWTFRNGQSTETFSSFKDCTCSGTDLYTLSGLNWLNDSVINFYLALIMERGKNHPVYPPVYAFNSYFYSSLKSRGPKAVMRWTRKIEDSKNIFQFDLLFVPLHLGMHWALCVVDNRAQKIKYYDSMLGRDDQCLRILQNYLVVEKKEKLGIVMDPSDYSLEIMQKIPQQMNGSDCGMFTLKYAEYISRDAPITFSQDNMGYFRRRMVIEILEKKLF